MRRHLLKIVLFYSLFELLRETAGIVSRWVRRNYQWPWDTSAQSIGLLLSGYLLFLLYPLSAFILFHRFFSKNKKKALLSWIGSVMIIISLRYLVEEMMYPALFGFRNYTPDVSLIYYFLDNIYFALLYSSFGIVYYFVLSERQHELNQTKLLLVNKQTELSFLRSQINPHFLFNSLNNIYSLVYHHSDQSLAAIAKLSDLMRYMLYDSNEQVPLQKELDYIHKYMELQQMRFDYALPATLELTGNPGKASIPPLLLIPFVENAFKHGDVRNGSTIRMRLQVDEHVIRFAVANDLRVQQKDMGGGIGLENVRRRLELLYPAQHRLDIRQTKDTFEVELEINK